MSNPSYEALNQQISDLAGQLWRVERGIRFLVGLHTPRSYKLDAEGARILEVREPDLEDRENFATEVLEGDRGADGSKVE